MLQLSNLKLYKNSHIINMAQLINSIPVGIYQSQGCELLVNLLGLVSATFNSRLPISQLGISLINFIKQTAIIKKITSQLLFIIQMSEKIIAQLQDLFHGRGADYAQPSTIQLAPKSQGFLPLEVQKGNNNKMEPCCQSKNKGEYLKKINTKFTKFKQNLLCIDKRVMAKLKNRSASEGKKTIQIKVEKMEGFGLTNSTSIIKQGCLQKMSKILHCVMFWERMLFLLTWEKLYFYDNIRKFVGCVNLKFTKVQLMNNPSQFEITLCIKGQYDLNLRCSEQKQYVSWVKSLKTVIQSNLMEQKLQIKKEIKQYFKFQDSIPEMQFLQSTQTGDILLFSAEGFLQKFQKVLTQSKFNHVAMVVKYPGIVYVFQSNLDDGVSKYEWKSFTQSFESAFEVITVRKLNCDEQHKMKIQEDLCQFVKNNLGHKFKLTPLKLLKRKSKNNFYQPKSKQEEDRTFFCSELIAKAYKAAGLISQQKSSVRYWPVDFSQSVNLNLKNASLGLQQPIILSRHISNEI